MAYLVGIGGGTGSGKGTITRLIRDHLTLWGKGCFILSTDDAYRDLSYLPDEERDALCFDPDFNFDHPRVIDFERLVAYARKLKDGKGFVYPRYDFRIHRYGPETREVPADLDVAIVEGIYALYSGPEVGRDERALVDLYDYTLFVATTPEIGVLRRIRRDIVERERDVEHAIRQLETTVIPMHKRYIEPTQQNADDLVDWRTGKVEDSEVKRKLVAIARQKAMHIHEAAGEAEGESALLPELDMSGVEIRPVS